MMLLVNLIVTVFVVFVLRRKAQAGTVMIKQLGLLELVLDLFSIDDGTVLCLQHVRD